MDKASLIGIIVGVVCLVVVFYEVSHGHFMMFYSLEGVLMVGGGSISVCLMGLPMHRIKCVPGYIKRFMFQKGRDPVEVVQAMATLGEKARRDGILALEPEIEKLQQTDPFLASGLRMAVDGVDPDGIEATLRMEIMAMQERHKAGKSETRDPGVKGFEQDVQSIRPSEYYAVSGSVPFPENSAELLAGAQSTIAEVAKKVRGLRLIVEVRGHVSSVEANRGPEQAMQLSSARAMAVAKALAIEGVAWWQLRLVVCADHDRVEAYPSNRNADKANARVEVIITDQVVPDEVPTRYDDPAATNSAWAPTSGGPAHSLP